MGTYTITHENGAAKLAFADVKSAQEAKALLLLSGIPAEAMELTPHNWEVRQSEKTVTVKDAGDAQIAEAYKHGEAAAKRLTEFAAQELQVTVQEGEKRTAAHVSIHLAPPRIRCNSSDEFEIDFPCPIYDQTDKPQASAMGVLFDKLKKNEHALPVVLKELQPLTIAIAAPSGRASHTQRLGKIFDMGNAAAVVRQAPPFMVKEIEGGRIQVTFPDDDEGRKKAVSLRALVMMGGEEASVVGLTARDGDGLVDQATSPQVALPMSQDRFYKVYSKYLEQPRNNGAHALAVLQESPVMQRLRGVASTMDLGLSEPTLRFSNSQGGMVATFVYANQNVLTNPVDTFRAKLAEQGIITSKVPKEADGKMVHYLDVALPPELESQKNLLDAFEAVVKSTRAMMLKQQPAQSAQLRL